MRFDLRNSRQALFASAALLAAWATEARAYLDPGTGSYVLQMIVAGLLGAAFAVKVFWTRIKSFVIRLFSRSPADE